MSMSDFFFAVKDSFTYSLFENDVWQGIVTRVEVPAGMVIGRFGVNKDKLLKRYNRRISKKGNVTLDDLKELDVKGAFSKR